VALENWRDMLQGGVDVMASKSFQQIVNLPAA